MAKRQPRTRLDSLVYQIDQLPRLSRIMLNMLWALMIVGILVSPLVLLLSTETLSNLIIFMAIGWVAVYAVGWWAMVGFDLDDQPWQAGKPAAWYTIVGVGATVALIAEFIFGLLYAFLL